MEITRGKSSRKEETLQEIIKERNDLQGNSNKHKVLEVKLQQLLFKAQVSGEFKSDDWKECPTHQRNLKNCQKLNRKKPITDRTEGKKRNYY